MNIKNVSKISGVDASTLRLYEEAGLLNISRDSNGDRIYNIDDIKAIHTIKLLKYFEIELAEIQKSHGWRDNFRINESSFRRKIG